MYMMSVKRFWVSSVGSTLDHTAIDDTHFFHDHINFARFIYNVVAKLVGHIIILYAIWSSSSEYSTHFSDRIWM